MNDLTSLKNIGPVLAEQLKSVGICNFAELNKIGAKNAWLKILEIDETACLHRLLALEGAINNLKKSELPTEIKAELKKFYCEIKGK